MFTLHVLKHYITIGVLDKAIILNTKWNLLDLDKTLTIYCPLINNYVMYVIHLIDL